MIRSKLALAAVSLAFAGAAFAQAKAQAPESWAARFKKADADGSGGLSKAELAKTAPGEFAFIKKNFDQLDTNKDGQVTIAERDAALKALEAKKTAAKK